MKTLLLLLFLTKETEMKKTVTIGQKQFTCPDHVDEGQLQATLNRVQSGESFDLVFPTLPDWMKPFLKDLVEKLLEEFLGA
jgi:hypothetical protein